MAFKEGEIVRYSGNMATIKMLGGYENGRDYDPRYFREDLVLIEYFSNLITVPISDLRKTTTEDKHAHRYLQIFRDNGRQLNQYAPRDIVSFHDNIQEVYDVRGQTLILEDGPVRPSEVIPVCFRNQRLDV